MASNNIARLGVVLGLDSAEFQKGVDQAIAENKKLKAAIQRESNAAAKEIMALKYATDDYGRSVSQVERLQREFLAGGKYARATQDLKNQLLAQAAAYDKKVAAEQRAYMSGSKLFQMTTQQRAALAYQTTDIITGLASGQNPLIVLIQQGGQLRDQFGGFIPLFKGIAQAFTLTRVAIGGLATAVAALGLAAYKSSSEVDDFNKSMILTGNLAGLTLDRFKQLSDQIAGRFNLSVATARSILTELASTGRFTGPALESVANVIAKISKLSGEAAEEVAKNLAGSFDGSAASAAALNQKYNFLTFAQYRQIELLATQGKNQEAAKLTADLLSEALDKQRIQVNYLSQAFTDLSNAISNAWQSFKDLFMPETNLQRMQRFAQEAEELIEKFGADPSKRTDKQNAAIGGKVLEYLGAFRIVSEEQEKLNKETIAKEKEKQQITDFIAAGGEKKRQDIIAETRKIYAEKEFQEKVANANEFQRIELEGIKKQQDAADEFYRQNELTRNQFRKELLEQYLARVASIEYETAQKKLEISRKEAETIEKEQQTRLDSIQAEKQKLELYRENLFLTDSQLEISLSRLRTEQEIARISANQKLDEKAKTEAMDRAKEIQRNREEVIKLSDDLKVLQDVNRSVFSSMEQAIDQFVRTGKVSFKDFARSIIQDILAIYIKSQMLSLFRMLPGMGTAFSYGTNIGSQQTAMLSAQESFFRADGGDVAANSPYIVGEKGPELFVPRNAGTIVPNNKMASAMSGNTYVTNNYIDAVDVKSFEDRLLASSNTVWAANQYANKSLAQSGGRA
jgi:phage-related minor tail protein